MSDTAYTIRKPPTETKQTTEVRMKAFLHIASAVSIATCR